MDVGGGAADNVCHSRNTVCWWITCSPTMIHKFGLSFGGKKKNRCNTSCTAVIVNFKIVEASIGQCTHFPQPYPFVQHHFGRGMGAGRSAASLTAKRYTASEGPEKATHAHMTCLPVHKRRQYGEQRPQQQQKNSACSLVVKKTLKSGGRSRFFILQRRYAPPPPTRPYAVTRLTQPGRRLVQKQKTGPREQLRADGESPLLAP